MALSKYQMEEMAEDFRKQAGATSVEDPIEPLKIKIEDVDVVTFEDIEEVDDETLHHLRNVGKTEWSAMSVPLTGSFDKWVIVRNHLHDIERQRVSLLEEYWHIILGHEPTRVVKIGNIHGRTFESEEEDEAFYLASATLLPSRSINNFIQQPEKNIADLARKYGVSVELAEYRIKRLGLWHKYRPKKISIVSD